MNTKQQQNAALLFVASFSSLALSQVIQSNGSNLMDFTQGVLTGLGIVGMLLAIVTIGRYYKRRH